MSEEEVLRAAGGWCAPSETIYDWPSSPAIAFPDIAVARGGIAAVPAKSNAAVEAMGRAIEALLRAQHDIVDRACITAMENRWDIEIHYPEQPFSAAWARDSHLIRLRHVGIAFTPAKHAIPTITERRNSDLDEFDWDD